MPEGYTDSEVARELDPRNDFKVPAAKGLSSPPECILWVPAGFCGHRTEMCMFSHIGSWKGAS